LNAGHCVEPFSGMQLCAVAVGNRIANAASKAAEFAMAMSLFFSNPSRCLRNDEGFMTARHKLQRLPRDCASAHRGRSRSFHHLSVCICRHSWYGK